MNRINYQKELEKILDKLKQNDRVPRLLLQSCCGPCSSYVLEYLSQYMEITVFYYNPNIYPQEEFYLRAKEQKRLIEEMNFNHPVSFVKGDYDPDCFFAMAKGMESEPEGHLRCKACYELRMREAARNAKKLGFDYFATTLTISPLKNAQVINEIGFRVGEEEGIDYLPGDFKKKDGYKRSVQLSLEYGLYRQDYCGCIFSKRRRQLEASKGIDTSTAF